MTLSILPFFNSAAYQDEVKIVTLPMQLLAQAMASELPECAERDVGMRKLLEAQDCFLRAAMIRAVASNQDDEISLDGVE